MALNTSFRGVAKNQELKNNIDIRDTRTLGQKFSDFSKTKNFPFIILGFFLVLSMIVPIYIEFICIFALAMIPVIKNSQSKFVLPFKLPETSHRLDWHQPKPGQRGTASMAQGTVFIGNEIGTNNELWLTDSDVRQHILLFGTTGAGKAFKLNEKFLTLNGWKENKDLKEGDYIMTPFGTYSKILSLFPQKNKKMMKVFFDNDEVKEVSEDHLWEFYFEKDNLEYLSFADFRKEQNVHISETKHILDFMKSGKRIYIPLSSETAKYAHEIILKNYSLNDLGYILKSNIANIEVNNENEGFKIIEKIIKEGSLKQKQTLKEAFLEELSLDPVYANHFRYKKHKIDEDLEVNHLKIYINSDYILQLIQQLFTYLGYKVKKEIDINNKRSLLIEKSNVLEILKIEESNTEDCQCIKIEDENGLLILENNITTHNTEALLSLLTNAFIQGSGFIFVDGKADLSTFAKVFSLCRSFRREDDLLVINYMTSGQDVFGLQEKLMSNTLNPFISGSSSGLTEMMVGLMDSGGGSDPMWQGRAIALISAVMSGLVWMRDNEGLLLDIDVLREYLLLDKIAELAEREYDGVESIAKAIRAYLLSIPGYNPQKPINQQESVVSEQHGYLQMQFTRILGSLSDTYGYIFRTNLGHVDFRDVVLNRRILLVLLPALEKSEPELQNLGKIVVSCIKSMMASTLGSILDTNIRDGVENRPTNALSAFYIGFDEYGYYIVKGSAVMPAQARSLGFCMIFAGQDLPSFQKNNNREESTSIIANCNLKIFMKVEDPGETFKLFRETAGQVLVEKQSSKERDLGSLSQHSYYDGNNVSYDKRDKGEWLDLKEQFDGEAHMLQGSNMVRAKFFFVNPEIPSNLKFRPNYFIKVEPPKQQDLINFIDVVENIKESLKDTNLIDDLKYSVNKNSTLDAIFEFYEATRRDTKVNDLGTALTLYVNYKVATLDDALDSVLNQYANMDKQHSGMPYVNTFGKQNQRTITPIDEDEEVQDIFLEESTVRKNMRSLETNLNNGNEKVGHEKTSKIISQLSSSTSYTDENLDLPDDIDGLEVSQIVRNLEKMLSGEYNDEE